MNMRDAPKIIVRASRILVIFLMKGGWGNQRCVMLSEIAVMSNDRSFVYSL